MELSSPTIAGHSFGSTTVLRTLNADKRFKWVGFQVTRINCFHEKLFAGSDWPWMPGCGRLETSRNWPRAWNNHFCSSIRKLFRRPPIWKRWSDSRSIRRITLSGASLLWSSYKKSLTPIDHPVRSIGFFVLKYISILCLPSPTFSSVFICFPISIHQR